MRDQGKGLGTVHLLRHTAPIQEADMLSFQYQEWATDIILDFGTRYGAVSLPSSSTESVPYHP